MPDVREEINWSVRESRIESRHSITRLWRMWSSSHDFEADLWWHSLTVDYDAFSNEEKVAVAAPVTSVEAMERGSNAMLALCLSILLLKCDRITGKVSTVVHSGKKFRSMSAYKYFIQLVQFFKRRWHNFSISVKLALKLCAQFLKHFIVCENSYFWQTSFSLCCEKLTSCWREAGGGVGITNLYN